VRALAELHSESPTHFINLTRNGMSCAATARPEGEYVEYDLDNEDEDWLAQFNEGQERLPPEKCVRQPACGTMTPSCGHHGRGN